MPCVAYDNNRHDPNYKARLPYIIYQSFGYLYVFLANSPTSWYSASPNTAIQRLKVIAKGSRKCYYHAVGFGGVTADSVFCINLVFPCRRLAICISIQLNPSKQDITLFNFFAAKMDSPCESEGSLDGGGAMLPPSSPGSRDQLQKRIDSLMQQNRVYKVELETYKIRVKVLQEENRALRQASVIIQAKAEQEEEYISNTLLKKIQALKKEKETLAHQYEREEECLTNELSRKLDQLRQEKCKLEQTLEQEQECLVNKLMRKIEKLEADTLSKQTNLEQLRREKIELENTLEQEQEALVNKLWKRMDKLESEKRSLQIKLDQPVSDTSNSKFE